MDILSRSDNGPGLEVLGLDVTRVTSAEVEEIKLAVYSRHVVAIRKQRRLSESEYLAFARRFGTLLKYPIHNYHHPEHPELYVSSNLKQPDGSRFGVAKTGDYWHTDLSFAAEPVSFTMLYMDRLPAARRETQFIDMADAYRELDPDFRARLDKCYGVHNANGRYKIRECDVGKAVRDVLEEVAQLCPDVRHPCVIRHPVTGERALYINEGFTIRIEPRFDPDITLGGVPASALAALFQFAHRAGRERNHEWRPDDILLWDNRTVNHRSGGVADDSPYVVWRASMFDGLSFY